MSLGSNGVDRVHSLRKIQTRLRGTNFFISCTSSAHFAPSFVQQRNCPKCTQTLRNVAKHGVDRLDLLQKLLTQLCGLNFCINYNSSTRFDPSIVKQRNGPKCPQTLWNKTKHEFRVQWGWISCIHCEKFGHDFVAWTFTLIAPVQPILHWVYCRNKTLWNAPKHKEMQQKMSLGSNGDGLDAFVVKTSNVTLWHELLY
jgi:hypothetical protein